MITFHPSETAGLATETTKENNINKVVLLKTNDNNNAMKASENVFTSSHYYHQKVPLKCLACDFTFVYPSKLAAHLSSYPDHYLMPQTYEKCENNLKKFKVTSIQTETSDDDCDGINEKDLIIIDDFINALLSNKLN